MGAFITMLRNVIVFVALALPGFLLVKTGQLKAEQSGALSKLLMYVGMPFLILSGTINTGLRNAFFKLMRLLSPEMR